MAEARRWSLDPRARDRQYQAASSARQLRVGDHLGLPVVDRLGLARGLAAHGGTVREELMRCDGGGGRQASIGVASEAEGVASACPLRVDRQIVTCSTTLLGLKFDVAATRGAWGSVATRHTRPHRL